MPLHIDPGNIFCKRSWVPIPRKMRLLNVHWSFLQWSWQCVVSTAKVMKAPNQQTSSPHLTSLWPSDLLSQTWPTLHRGALQGPTGVCRMDWYGELCFWLRGLGDCCLVWVPLLQAARTQWKPWAIAPHEARWHHSGDWERPHLCAKQQILQSWDQWYLAVVWGSLPCGACTNSTEPGSSSHEIPSW